MIPSNYQWFTFNPPYADRGPSVNKPRRRDMYPVICPRSSSNRSTNSPSSRSVGTPLAIVTARGVNLAGRDKRLRRQWTDPTRNLRRRQGAAERLMAEVGLGPGAWGPAELRQVATAPSLSQYWIVVLDGNRTYLPMVYGRGPRTLYLYYNDHHYDTIKSITGFLVKNYFCETCLKGYDSAGCHRCPGNRAVHCTSCGQNTCSEYKEAFQMYRSPTVTCGDCHRSFFGATCLLNHKTHTIGGQPALGTTSVCHTRRKCGTCHLYLKTKKEIRQHKCGHAKCHSCKEYVNIDTHRCYVQKATLEEPDEDTVPPLHVFFDIEAKQGRTKHIPNLLVCQRSDDDVFHRWYGEDCVRAFLLKLEEWCEDGKQPLTVLAHNFQGYDSYPSIEKLHLLGSHLKQIRNGGKVLQLTCFKNHCVRFIDSMSFFPMKLSKFPKTFGLTELKKGYFPHLFNKDGNQDYVGPLPPVEDYLPNSMSVDDKKEFLSWHADLTRRGYVFDFKKELMEYCQSDVRLLKEGCMTFMRDFRAEAGFDPFECMTIASACNRFLRTHKLEEGTIAVEPLQGWGGRKVNQSPVAFEWLTWEGYRRETTLQHAHQGGEFRPLPGRHYTVDGYDQAKRTVYEFDGCFWHGCPSCFPQRHEPHPRHLGKTMADVCQEREEKHRLLREAGYRVVSMWECQWKRLRTREPASHPAVAPRPSCASALGPTGRLFWRADQRLPLVL